MNGLVHLTISVRERLTGEDEEGQGLVEYGLILMLVAMVLIGALSVLGQQLAIAFEDVANALP